MPPLVSLQTSQKSAAKAPIDTGEERLPTTFSFYAHLADKPDSVESSGDDKASAAQPKKKPQAQASPEPKPEPKPASKPNPDAIKPAAASETESIGAAKVAKVTAAEKVIKQVAEVLDEGDNAGKLPARYTLQVGSHTDRAKADRQVENLEGMGLEPHVIMVEVPNRGRFYRVRIGKFHSMEEARGFQGSIQTNRGVSSFVSPI